MFFYHVDGVTCACARELPLPRAQEPAAGAPLVWLYERSPEQSRASFAPCDLRQLSAPVEDVRFLDCSRLESPAPEHPALTAALEAQTPAAEKTPILLSGILTDAPGFNAILDDLGLHIVADDVAAQSRQYRTDVPAGDDALTALAQKFADMDNCSVLYNAAKPRVQWIVDTAKARNAKGVLVAMTKFCDPEEFDYVMIKKACEAAGIPVTVVEIDRQMVQFEQARTNIETFRDMLTM